MDRQGVGPVAVVDLGCPADRVALARLAVVAIIGDRRGSEEQGPLLGVDRP